MATTVDAQPFLVTVLTQITLNGQEKITENTLTVEDVNEYDERIMTVSVYGTELVKFRDTAGAGTFIKGDMKYFQVTNLDTVNYALITVAREGVDAFGIKLDAGKTFMMGNPKEGVAAYSMGVSVYGRSIALNTLVDAYSITALAYSAPVDVQYVVAST